MLGTRIRGCPSTMTVNQSLVYSSGRKCVIQPLNKTSKLKISVTCDFVLAQSSAASKEFRLQNSTLGSTRAMVFMNFPKMPHTGILPPPRTLSNQQMIRYQSRSHRQIPNVLITRPPPFFIIINPYLLVGEDVDSYFP